MIISLLYFCYLTLISLVVGEVGLILFQKLFGTENKTTSIFITIITGICLLSFLLTILHFFAPINSSVFITLSVLIGLLGLFKYTFYKSRIKDLVKRITDLDFIHKSMLFFVTLFITYLGTDLPIYNLDEGRYHFQALLWTKSYSLVPGLVHLDHRFGSASSWYNLHAFLDCFYLKERSYHILNSYLIALLTAYCIIHLPSTNRKITASSIAVIFCLLFLLIPFHYFRYWHFGMTPDLPIHVFVIFTFLFLTQYPNYIFDSLFVFLITLIGLTTFSYRVSGGVLMLVPCCLWLGNIIKAKKWNATHTFTPILVIIFSLIIVIRSVILTGWALYPLASIDLFNFDWELPQAWVQNISNAKNHMLPNAALVSQMDSLSRLKVILDFFSEGHIKQFGLFSLVPIGGILMFITFYLKRKMMNSSLFFIGILSLLSFLGWYIMAPLLRFGFGFACVGFSFCLAISLYYLFIQEHIFLKNSLVKIIPVFFLGFFMYRALQSIPVSISKNKQHYPIELLSYLVDHAEDFYALKKVPNSDHCLLPINNNLAIHISDCDDSFSTKGRMPLWLPDCNGEGIPEAKGMKMGGMSDCIACGGERVNFYRRGVGVMNWMNPLPAIGGVCPEFEARGSSLGDGFKVKSTGELSLN